MAVSILAAHNMNGRSFKSKTTNQAAFSTMIIRVLFKKFAMQQNKFKLRDADAIR